MTLPERNQPNYYSARTRVGAAALILATAVITFGNSITRGERRGADALSLAQLRTATLAMNGVVVIKNGTVYSSTEPIAANPTEIDASEGKGDARETVHSDHPLVVKRPVILTDSVGNTVYEWDTKEGLSFLPSTPTVDTERYMLPNASSLAIPITVNERGMVTSQDPEIPSISIGMQLNFDNRQQVQLFVGGLRPLPQ